jgi:tRNA G18 (ribose-2'-O)-methylase SpoU
MSSVGTERKHYDDEEEPPTIFLLLENPTRNNNLGPFIRCASAFGISTIVAVGFAKCSDKGA